MLNKGVPIHFNFAKINRKQKLNLKELQHDNIILGLTNGLNKNYKMHQKKKKKPIMYLNRSCKDLIRYNMTSILECLCVHICLFGFFLMSQLTSLT